MRKSNVRNLTVAAVLIAMAYVVNNFLPKFRMPYGGSVTIFSMFILFYIGYVLGTKWGIGACIAYGLLDMLLAGPGSIVSAIQAIVDYPLAFGALGVGSILRDRKNGMYTGYFLSACLRFVFCFLSGWLFFGEYAPEGFNGVTYSLVYNGTYIFVEAIITEIVLMIKPVHSFLEKLARDNRA